jgi:predicted membrane protein
MARKHKKMDSGLFWGLLLIVLGSILILRVVLHVDLPIFKILVAFVFIFIGLRILFGNFSVTDKRPGKCDAVFSNTSVNNIDKENNEYNIVFGKGVFDFRSVNFEQLGNVNIKIDNVFSGSEIYLPQSIPVKIDAESVFGGVELPGGNAVAFGNNTYTSPDFDANSKFIYMKIECVFGGVKVIR